LLIIFFSKFRKQMHCLSLTLEVRASKSGTSLCCPCKPLVLDMRCYWYQMCKFLQVTSTVTTKRIGAHLHKFMKYT
jgi:hypothetical protein